MEKAIIAYKSYYDFVRRYEHALYEIFRRVHDVVVTKVPQSTTTLWKSILCQALSEVQLTKQLLCKQL